MNFQFSIFEVLLLIGITQGFVTAILIWLNKKRTIGKLLLSLVLTVFNLLCLKILILTTGLWQTGFFHYFPLAFELAIQPLIWLYIASLTVPGFKLNKQTLLHFVPFAISFTYSLGVYIAVLPHATSIQKDKIANGLHFNQVKEIEDYLSIISSIVYWLLGLRLVIRYRRWLYNNISSTDYPTYAWLKNIAVLMGLLIGGLSADIALDYYYHFNQHHFAHWQIFFIYLAILIYYIGFRGFQLQAKPLAVDKNNGLDYLPGKQEITALAGETISETAVTNPLPVDNVAATKLTNEKDNQVQAAIICALEIDELYLDPELNLQKLAAYINASPAIVSAVINSSLQKSFRNLVNEYRVKKVKQLLEKTKSAQFSILGIAYKCGFNSESSFYRIFKTETGIPPKEYIKQTAGKL